MQHLLQGALREETTPLSAAEKIRLVRELIDDILGHGPIEPYLQDPTVSEIMVNGPEGIYVEHEGRLARVDSQFIDETHLRRAIERIVGAVGRRTDESSPMVGGPYLTAPGSTPSTRPSASAAPT